MSGSGDNHRIERLTGPSTGRSRPPRQDFTLRRDAYNYASQQSEGTQQTFQPSRDTGQEIRRKPVPDRQMQQSEGTQQTSQPSRDTGQEIRRKPVPDRQMQQSEGTQQTSQPSRDTGQEIEGNIPYPKMEARSTGERPPSLDRYLHKQQVMQERLADLPHLSHKTPPTTDVQTLAALEGKTETKFSKKGYEEFKKENAKAVRQESGDLINSEETLDALREEAIESIINLGKG